jgi:hypothetical protein
VRRQTYKFDQELIKRLVQQAEVKEPSGRLSATRLTWPTQWQVLWTLKVPTSPELWQEKPDKMNTLHFRHFARGAQCEEWLEKVFPPLEKQVEVNYRGWVGYIDRMENGELFGVDHDVPHEIKSVKADKWYKMFQEGEPEPQYDHVLQANFYALAKELPTFALTYLKSDTLESRTFVYDAGDFQGEVDKQIDEYDEAMKSGTIPKFKAKIDYQKNPKYNQYWEYMGMKEKELQDLYNKYDSSNSVGGSVLTGLSVGGAIPLRSGD